jgi:hypothetical protein
VFGITHFERFVGARSFVLHSDHQPLVTYKSGSPRRTHKRIKEFLAEKSFELRHVKEKDNPSDYLSRFADEVAKKGEKEAVKDSKVQELQS